MIDYNSALQLKNAGFPQEGKDGDWYYDANGKSDFQIAYNYDKWSIKIPTLSELILEVYKYCHEYRLECVKDNPGVWAACTCWGNLDEDDWVTGNSPEEVTAKLWLTLYKKSADVE